ncbi:hypothetical protein AO498_07317 [Algoriphagus sanaruensis]|uniref:Uncharacterized protein n=1 Tax=Algoriphagus sanaruensis TaxID=1727163 RepID=A0A142EM65_9BACT|nr:hypothetical protein AO498_07317 [Algoriphagus sanaruensis]
MHRWFTYLPNNGQVGEPWVIFIFSNKTFHLHLKNTHYWVFYNKASLYLKVVSVEDGAVFDSFKVGDRFAIFAHFAYPIGREGVSPASSEVA